MTITVPVKLADMPFDPVYTKEDVNKAFEFLEGQRSKMDKGRQPCYNGQYAGFANGKKVAEVTNGPCHGSLSLMQSSSILATITHPPQGCNVSTYSHYTSENPAGYDIEAVRRFYDWLINQSPFGRFLVETTVDSAMELGLIISCDVPANILAMICVMSRHQREKHGKLRAWDYLVQEKGWVPEVAWFWAFNTGFWDTVSGKNLKMAESAYVHGAGHDLFYPPTTELCKNFCNDFTVVKMSEGLFKTNANYGSGISATFGPNGTSHTSFIKEINNLIKDMKKGVKTEDSVKIKNPFGDYNRSTVSTVSTISKADFLEHGKEASEQLWKNH